MVWYRYFYEFDTSNLGESMEANQYMEPTLQRRYMRSDIMLN